MRKPEDVIAKARADRRKFRRVRIDQPGKLFLPATMQELVCMVVNISPGGAMITCDSALRWGDKVVLYIDGLGRFEGVVARVDGYGIGINFTSTALKRERTAEQLTVYINRGLVDERTLRRHERVQIKGYCRLVRNTGQIISVEIIDVSLSGMAVRTPERPPIGEFVLIGQLAARVARHLAEGLGLEFIGVTFVNTDLVQGKLSVSVAP